MVIGGGVGDCTTAGEMGGRDSSERRSSGLCKVGNGLFMGKLSMRGSGLDTIGAGTDIGGSGTVSGTSETTGVSFAKSSISNGVTCGDPWNGGMLGTGNVGDPRNGGISGNGVSMILEAIVGLIILPSDSVANGEPASRGVDIGTGMGIAGGVYVCVMFPPALIIGMSP